MEVVNESSEAKRTDNIVMEQLITRLGTDTRNALHALLGMLELIEEESLSQQQEQYLSACRTTADRLLSTVNDVTELAQLDPPQVQQCPFRLSEAVRNASALMEALAHSKRLNYTCTLDDGGVEFVLGDRARIEDMLLRVLGNAIRFTERGGVDLSVRLASAGPALVKAEFVVSDTGAGILDDTIAIPDRLADHGGLGLTIVRRLVDHLGGEIGISSQPEAGSRISISITFQTAGISKECADTTCREDVHRPGPGGSLKLLVAEDSDDSFLLLKAFLKQKDCCLIRATDGAQAVKLFREADYDVVLMDVHMPIMDGYTAIRAMREFETSAGRCRTPIVLLSAEPIAKQQRIAASSGCSAYLTKPVSKSALLSTLERYCDCSAEN